MTTKGKVFSFKEQLRVGDEGEALFQEHYHDGPLIKIPEHYADFKTQDGKVLELKTDTYDMDKTSNFYIERWSDVAKKKPGSVWQSRANGVDIFCYFFINNSTYFQFTDMSTLEKELDAYIKDKSYVIVRNRWGNSHGYKVPRKLLSGLYTVHTVSADRKKGD